MSSSSKKRSRLFSARPKKDLCPCPPTPDSQGREASSPQSAPPSKWFGPQPRGRRKTARPFVPNRPLEARLSASRARGAWSFDRPANRAGIRKVLAKEAARSGVTLRKVTFAGTCLELELAAPDRPCLAQFFRTVAGRIPRVVAGAERGRPLPAGGFWDGLVATRVLA